ncbi:MAG: phospholipid carrier-dependent glycosyltransferase, partial [Chloroflexi bacterium]|nr:phospholipid carrier-dependent glycosyltransferase [Chloroflexota bacterium]
MLQMAANNIDKPVDEMQSRGFHRWWWLVAPGLALLLYSVTIVTHHFDGLYGQDAFGYYQYTLQVWQSLRHLSLPPPYFWPMGYPALVAGVYTLTGSVSLAGQIASVLTGAGVVVLTGALARDLLIQQGIPKREAIWVGIVAALLAVACGQLWQWSIAMMSDSAGLFWATLSAWAMVRYGGTGRLRWLILASFALAWAIMTRWIYGLLIIPLACYGVWALMQLQKKQLASPSAFLRRQMIQVLLSAGIGIVLLMPQLRLTAVFPAPLLQHQWVVGWSPLNAVRREFTTPDGYAAYPLPVLLFYAKAAISPRFLFPLFTPFLLLGMGIVLWRRWWPVILLLGLWDAVIFIFLIGIPYQNFRFTLPLLPPIAILAALGLNQVWSRADIWFQDHAWGWSVRYVRPLLMVYLLCGLLGGVWYSGRVVDDFIARKDADLAAVRWVEGQVRAEYSQHGATGAQAKPKVLAFGLTLMLQHYSALNVEE